MNRAAVAAIHLNGVLLGVGAVVLVRLHAAIANGVELAGLRLARLDGAAFCLGPVQALARRPTAALVVVFRPFLLGRRHDVVVVGAHDVGNHVVGKLGDGLRVGYVHAAVAFDDDSLALLGAQNGTKASACGVVARVNEACVGKQVLASGADGCNAELVAILAADGFGGCAGAHAPNEGCIFDGDLVVENLNVDGLVGSAFNNQAIPASKLKLGADHAAAVRIDNQMIGGVGGQMREGGTASQRNARSGERADGHDDLAFGAERIGARGNFVIHNFVGHAHAAQEIFVRVGGLGGDFSRGQVHSGDLALPTIGDIFSCHVFLQVFAVTLKRACEDMCAIDPLLVVECSVPQAVPCLYPVAGYCSFTWLFIPLQGTGHMRWHPLCNSCEACKESCVNRREV